ARRPAPGAEQQRRSVRNRERSSTQRRPGRALHLAVVSLPIRRWQDGGDPFHWRDRAAGRLRARLASRSSLCQRALSGRIRNLRPLKARPAFLSRTPAPDLRCHSTKPPTIPIHAARRAIALEVGAILPAVSTRDIDLRKATSRQSPKTSPIGLAERMAGRPTAKARTGTSRVSGTHRRRA